MQVPESIHKAERVFICGSRDWTDEEKIAVVLRELEGICWPKTRGTRDMIERALYGGVEVILIGDGEK